METVTSADGTSIAFEQHGQGPPIILVHGGSAPVYWKPVIPHLSDDYTVVVPHRRGVGASDDTSEYSLARGVEDMRAVIESLDESPVLFGHSFGGLLALETARRTSVKKLLAYEPAVLAGEYRRQADLASRMQSQIDNGERRQAMKYYIREVMHGGEIDDLDAWLAEWPPWPDIVALTENIVRINRVIEEYQLPSTIETGCPTLLLTGSDGPPHLRDGIRAVHEATPTSKIVEFDGLGHGGPAEAPNHVTSELRHFIHKGEVQATEAP